MNFNSIFMLINYMLILKKKHVAGKKMYVNMVIYFVKDVLHPDILVEYLHLDARGIIVNIEIMCYCKVKWKNPNFKI